VDQSESVFLDSFCDKSRRDDCTKKSGECPSWGNDFSRNVMARLAPKVKGTPVRAVGAESPPGCPRPPAGGKRVTVDANRVER
jgi:hypothetical protein